jgi:hypothetical protein
MHNFNSIFFEVMGTRFVNFLIQFLVLIFFSEKRILNNKIGNSQIPVPITSKKKDNGFIFKTAVERELRIFHITENAES